jgi:hypothetical protein
MVLLVVVHNLNVVSVSLAPDETDAPLIVDPDTMLSGPIAFEHFQPVARRRYQVSKLNSNIKLAKLALDDTLDCTEARHPFPAMKLLRLLRPERTNHNPRV